MKATIVHQNQDYQIDFSKPLDISLTITNDDNNPIAWYLSAPEINPVVMGDWIGKVSEGKSSTNFFNIKFNPHAHGTHTECLGHITRDFFSVNEQIKTFFHFAQLVSITPEEIDGDRVITLEQVEKSFSDKNPEAFIIRTLPNVGEKKHLNYSHTNPPYLCAKAATFLREQGVKHLLIDLPSVDKENDEGKLLAHKAFWNVKDVVNLNEDARKDCSITEMIFVDNHIADGHFFLQLSFASFHNDASPSKPVLYAFE